MEPKMRGIHTFMHSTDVTKFLGMCAAMSQIPRFCISHNIKAEQVYWGTTLPCLLKRRHAAVMNSCSLQRCRFVWSIDSAMQCLGLNPSAFL